MEGWHEVRKFTDDLVGHMYALEDAQSVPLVSDGELSEMVRSLQCAIHLEYQKVNSGQCIVSDHLKLYRFRMWLEPDMEGDWSLLARGIVRMILDWEKGLGCEPAALEGHETPAVFLMLPLSEGQGRRIKVRHYYGLRE